MQTTDIKKGIPVYKSANPKEAVETQIPYDDNYNTENKKSQEGNPHSDRKMLYAAKKQTVGTNSPQLSPNGVSGSSVNPNTADFLGIVNTFNIKNVFRQR